MDTLDPIVKERISKALFWQEILNMEDTIEKSENNVVFVNYLGNGLYSDFVHIN